MSEEEKIELRTQDGKAESQKEVSDETQDVNRQSSNVNEEAKQSQTEN